MIRKVLIGLAILLFVSLTWFSLAISSVIDVSGEQNNTSFGPITLTALQTATGYGTNTFVLPAFMKSFTWTQVVVTGEVSTVLASIYGGGDGLTYASLDSSTTTPSEMRSFVNKPVRYIRSYVTALSGTAPAITIKIWGTVY